MATTGGHLEFVGRAIRAFEADYGRELNLDEKVALASNTRQKVREHFAAETGIKATF